MSLYRRIEMDYFASKDLSSNIFPYIQIIYTYLSKYKDKLNNDNNIYHLLNILRNSEKYKHDEKFVSVIDTYCEIDLNYFLYLSTKEYQKNISQIKQ